ncbi:hypothetical protein Tsubulata_023681 [Turnera subulata]|uniref:glutathione transferase n=1 Tax=Turnera subulata TaxID=218843 RepID=A0A9Q0F941_9ROSI|nr:hypothetical protein Tsubulata_023681 [Turnera subulata]
MGEVQVLGSWGSPYSRRVEMALKLKGVEYEFIEQDLANKSPLLLKYNPIHQKVPVLVHNGQAIAESVVILEYIDETWKGYPLLPQDPYGRARARFWAKFIDDKCYTAIWQTVWIKERKEREKAIEEASHHLKTLENELRDNKFFGGETIGLVDIVSNFFSFWPDIVQEAAGVEIVTEERFPFLCKWKIEFTSCSAIKENLPDRDKLLAYLKAQFTRSAWKY